MTSDGIPGPPVADGNMLNHWCEQEALLSSIFGFNHANCSQLQSVGSIQSFCDMLFRFCDHVQNLSSLWPTLSENDHRALRAAAQTLTTSSSVHWYPEYACALLTLPGSPAVEHDIRAFVDVSLLLLGLDQWRFRTHTVIQGAIQQTSCCEGCTVLYAESVASADRDKLIALLDMLLRKAQTRKKEKRSAATNQQGHQKTPAFIHALLKDAINKLENHNAVEGEEIEDEDKMPRHKPEGGFTDVGLHTGGHPRDTSWPLAREAFKTVLLETSNGENQPSQDLFEHAMAHFYLWILQRQLQLIDPGSATPLMLNVLMKMLQKAVDQASKLAHQGYALLHFERACASARQKLDGLALQRASHSANLFNLVTSFTGIQNGAFEVCEEQKKQQQQQQQQCRPSDSKFQIPTGVIPPLPAASAPNTDVDALNKRTLKNLNLLWLPPASYGFAELLLMLKNRHTQVDTQGLVVQHVLCIIERALFRCAKNNFVVHTPMSDCEADALTQLVDLYRERLQAFMKTKAGEARMRVELYSREALVAHVAYCIFDAATRKAHPDVMQAVGVGLSKDGLKHLVLGDKTACDAALSVASYLQRHASSSPLFLLTAVHPTFSFAARFAKGDAKMQQIWKDEQTAAEGRKNVHWGKIRTQQQRLRELRAQLGEERQTLEECKEAFERLEQERIRWGGRRQHTPPGYIDTLRKKNEAETAVSTTESQIKSWGKPPPPVMQPLPKSSDTAFSWLFFLYMPPLFRNLSRMCFLAHQLLLPRDKEPSQLSWKLRLTDHYNNHQKGLYQVAHSTRTGTEGAVLFVSSSEIPEANAIGPQHVDAYRSPDNGVWHPDELDRSMGWSGSGSCADAFSGAFNPFKKASNIATAVFFTEQLHEDTRKALQWAVPLYGCNDVSPKRGNEGIACQDARPFWLSKPGWLDLCSLRAFPYLQLRKLCIALRNRTLPLGHPAVQTIIRQALYHMGDLSESHQTQPVALLWRTEWDANQSDLLPALCHEIEMLADELAEMPRNYESVGILGELSAYLSEWHKPFLPLSRSFAAMASRWADDLETLVLDGAAENARHIRAKQCLLRMTAQVCHVNGDLDDSDVLCMVKLAVLINYGRVFEDDDPLLEHIASMHVRCHHVMVKRSVQLLKIIDQHRDMLTEAVRLVLHRAPENLQWGQWKSTSEDEARPSICGFRAKGDDGHCYDINVLDGTVLLDGWPLKRLPNDIMQHPLYQRTFGSWNFEIAGSGVYRTVRPVRGRFYEFYMADDGVLIIKEIDERQNRMQLLDVHDAAGFARWGGELPVRLRELYSHWLNRDKRILVLRPHDFRKHNIHFILQWDPADSTSNKIEYTCRRVPNHLAPLHWADLLREPYDAQLTDRLVLHSSNVSRVLSKFEKVEYIHFYVDSNAPLFPADSNSVCGGSLIIEMPRYGLEFEATREGLLSLDYRGYRLAQQQQLAVPLVMEGYTLPDFQQYLVLERIPGRVAATHRAHVLVLVPCGIVTPHTQQLGLGKACVSIQLDTASGAHLETHAYEVHERFGHLCANSIPSRLQLAALYAATASLLPDPSRCMTGAEISMQLLRQCWSNRPLSTSESDQLQSIAHLGRHLAAGLPLLVHELQTSAAQLNDFHFPYDVPECCLAPILSSDAGCAYLTERCEKASSKWHHSRSLLNAHEEQRVLGRSRESPTAFSSPVWLRLKQFDPVEVPQCPVDARLVPNVERKLRSLVVRNPMSSGKRPRGDSQDPGMKRYPLASTGKTPLEQEMHAELQASWEAHHGGAAQLEVAPQAKDIVSAAEAKVRKQCYDAKRYLQSHLKCVPQGLGHHGVGFRMAVQAGIAASPGELDLVALTLEPELAKRFNPFLSDASVDRLQQGALRWLQLCVLHRRLQRILRLLQQHDEDGDEGRGRQALLIQELQVHRTWDVASHPEWLVFEAEGLLQIRPAQHLVAEYLLKHPGAIVQLNMGEGKTRVILPMLVLHWVKQRNAVVRLNLLPALLDEAYAYLHAHLCASVLGRKLFVQPFHRDILLTPGKIRAMRASLNYCQQDGGLLLVAPEHRLSLMLKRQELWEQNRRDLCALLDSVAGMQYIDLLDESDELLHHRFQLIYAWGNRMALPALQSRARAAQALLHALSRQAISGKGTIGLALHGSLESQPGPHHHQASFAVASQGAADGEEKKAGAFAGVRLLPGPSLQDALPRLHKELAEAVFDTPPYEMSWMKGHELQAKLIDVIIEPEVDANAMLESDEMQCLSDKQRADVMAVRGLLACQILAHSLQMRHRVNYGVSRLPTARRRLAVPFRAADTPSERSEYAQPDSALVLTTLAYYADGLSFQELLEALRVLLSLGASAQRSHYDEWLAVAREDPKAAAIPETLNAVSKIDTSNALQMQDMHVYFSHNMCTINFWLNYCVFSKEMQQFPQRLMSSAWHLAENVGGHVVGFSGTNDNHRLLPLQVQLHVLEEQSLHATNGKMLDLILRESPQYTTLNIEGNTPVWQAVLELAVSEGTDALLDCGALLAGASNRDAARFLVGHLLKASQATTTTSATATNRFQGVCYYDADDRCWTIMELTGRKTSHTNSRISEQHAFTIYDEARCRGADLKLRQRAVGLATVGPNCCKDKLMQAAGRLRQLGRGQTLRFVGTPDVTDKIAAFNGVATDDDGKSTDGEQQQLTSRHMLQWIMHNTVQATLGGILEWSRQGLHFVRAKGSPQQALRDEMLELTEMYGSSKNKKQVTEVVAGMASHAKEHLPLAALKNMAITIKERAEQHGQGHVVLSQGGFDEEVERELEREEEEEEEVERQIPRMESAAEKDWEYSKVVGAVSIDQVANVVGAMSLAKAAEHLRPSSVGGIPWSKHVYCTANFLSTICGDGQATIQNEYLRPVDAVVLFPPSPNKSPSSPDVLLLSEREANGLLELLLKTASSRQTNNGAAVQSSTKLHQDGINNTTILMHLSYASEAFSSSHAPLRLAIATRNPQQISNPAHGVQEEPQQGGTDCVRQLVSVQLFHGETTYVDAGGRGWEEMKELPWLKQLEYLVHSRWEAAEALVAMRGRQALFSRSQLELACKVSSG